MGLKGSTKMESVEAHFATGKARGFNIHLLKSSMCEDDQHSHKDSHHNSILQQNRWRLFISLSDLYHLLHFGLLQSPLLFYFIFWKLSHLFWLRNTPFSIAIVHLSSSSISVSMEIFFQLSMSTLRIIHIRIEEFWFGYLVFSFFETHRTE